MEIQVLYVKQAEWGIFINTIIEQKGLGQRFEERRRGRQADVFNIIQKRPNTVVHLKVDGNGGSQAADGGEEQVGGEPSLLSVWPSAHAKAPQTLQVRARPNTNQELRLQIPLPRHPLCNYVTSSAVSNHVEVRGGDCGCLGVLLAANRVFSLSSDNTGMVPRTFWTWFGRFLTPARSSLPTNGR